MQRVALFTALAVPTISSLAAAEFVALAHRLR
jgi:hypothetical protein